MINNAELDNLNHININFSMVDDAKSYTVLYKTDSMKDFEILSENSKELFTLQNDFVYNTKYQYKVQATSKIGTKSGFSKTYTFEVKENDSKI